MEDAATTKRVLDNFSPLRKQEYLIIYATILSYYYQSFQLQVEIKFTYKHSTKGDPKQEIALTLHITT